MKSLKDIRTQIDEVLTKKDPAAKWIHDFVHSDNPQFAGKSMAKRRQMALAAYYSKKNEAAFVSPSMSTDIKGDLEEAFLTKKEEDDLDNLSSDDFVKKYGHAKHAHRKSHATRSADVEKFTESQEEDDRQAAEHHQKELEQQQQELEAKKKKEKVKEEVEQIDELSKKTLGSYVKKASHSAALSARFDDRDSPKAPAAALKRLKGIAKAANKLTKEEVDLTEDIKKEYEGLKKHDIKTLRGMIKQQHRIIDTSEFRTKEHAISHILNNKHGNKRVMSALGEELEQIDEISKHALVNYINKASHDAASGAYAGKDYISHSQQHTAAGDWEASKKKHDMATKEFDRANKRLKNIPKAAVKLARKKTFEEFVQGLEESRGHKVIATFLKNREVAQRAFTGQNKPAEKKPEPEKKEIKEGFDDYHAIAKELVKRHGKNVDTGHINDLAGERDSHRGLDHSEVMHHVNKILNAKKEVKEGEVYDEKWKKFKKIKEGVSMLNFNDFLKEAWQEGAGKARMQEKLVGNQHKLDKNKNGKIDSDDLKQLRGEGILKPELEKSFPARGVKTGASAPKGTTYMPKKDVKEEVEQIDEISAKLAKRYQSKIGHDIDRANDAWPHGTGDDDEDRKLNNRVKGSDRADDIIAGKAYKKEEVEQIDEISKKTLGSYVKKASADIAKREVRIDRAMDASGSNYNEPSMQKALNKNVKRVAGLNKAADKLAKEEVEQIDELSRDTLMSYRHKAGNSAIKMHDKSEKIDGRKDQFGKWAMGQKALKRMANYQLATRKIQKKDRNALYKEEAEQIDEISKDTLASYIPKAAKSSRIHGMISKDYANAAERKRNPGLKRALDSLSKKYKSKAWKREDGIATAVKKLTKEDVQLDEGKMKELAMDLKDMSHDEFHKTYGKPKSHFDPTNFKKPVQKGHEMDRAKELAQRGLKSVLSKEEVETVAEDNHVMSYVNATLAVMDEGKLDDLRDAQKLRAANKSAYDKDYKADTSHPHITTHKGTSYGGQAQKDDEGDEKPEVEKEKRGRGRPHGSKSGARQKGNGREDGGIPVHNLHLPNRNK